MREELDRLVDAVRQSRNYRSVDEGLIREIGGRELEHRRNPREAVKATKNRLHQIGGAFMDGPRDYRKWLAEITAAADTRDPDVLRMSCKRVMAHHASTRERLPILERFYAEVLGDLPPVRSVLDIACGLNPLSAPWMPLAPGAEYHACDIYGDMVGFLNACLPVMGITGRASVCDAVRSVPSVEADVALILKIVPCLDQLDKTASARLLDSINADHLVVSFPVHSLGGRRKGMPATYSERFHDLTAGRTWDVRRFEFETELAFRISR